MTLPTITDPLRPDGLAPRYSLAVAGVRYCAATLAELRAYGVADAPLLEGVRADLAGRIDACAEALRATYITAGAGQAMEYQEAQAQAFAALAGPPAEATAERYPMLAASLDIDRDPLTGLPASDVLGVARAVEAAYRGWLTAGAAIRAARLAGKAALAVAPTPEAAEAAFATVAWPSAA